jgi:hypothetical protein
VVARRLVTLATIALVVEYLDLFVARLLICDSSIETRNERSVNMVPMAHVNSNRRSLVAVAGASCTLQEQLTV